MGKYVERVFKNNSLRLKSASHNNASWYTDTVGFLEHSLSVGSLYYKGPVLQKIILFLPPTSYSGVFRGNSEHPDPLRLRQAEQRLTPSGYCGSTSYTPRVWREGWVGVLQGEGTPDT